MAKSYDISYHCETANKNIRITATPLRNNSQTQRICNMSESYCQYKRLYPEFCVNSALDVKQSKIFTRRHCNSRPPL